jgi:anti-anti-sigma factor
MIGGNTDGGVPMSEAGVALPLFETLLREDRGAQVVTAKGELDLNSVPHLCKLIEEAEASLDDHTPVLVDLSGVEFMDYEILKVLIETHYKLRASGVELRLVESEGLPARLLGLTGFDEVFNIYPNRNSALA